MKTPQFSFLFAASMIFAAASLACSNGGGSNGTGAGGSGGGAALTDCATVTPSSNVISDFESSMGVVLQNGTPQRNGYWYTYNDMTTGTCTQTPGIGAAFTATLIPNGGRCLQSSFALETKGSGCSTWGAGIGADLAQPALESGTYMGPKKQYDVTAFVGVKFYARSEPSKSIDLRIKFPMFADTKVADGGGCTATETGTDKCSDDFGKALALTTNWKRYNVLFSDLTQEGWGKVFTWNPTDVTSIQLQNKMGDDFDFWVDDFAFCASPADCMGTQ